MEPVFWLGALILLVLIELGTAGLTTIWFAFGALVSLILSMIGLEIGWQVAAFLVVSVLLLVFTRPLAMKLLKKGTLKTNVEGLVGKTIRITENVDNISATGEGMADGNVWTVRMADDRMTMKAGELARVVAISGVKLIVMPASAPVETQQ